MDRRRFGQQNVRPRTPTNCTLPHFALPWRFRVMRYFAWFTLLLVPSSVLASESHNPSAPPLSSFIQGIVADPTGAIVPDAEVDLVDTGGAVAATGHTGEDGSFRLTAPRT